MQTIKYQLDIENCEKQVIQIRRMSLNHQLFLNFSLFFKSHFATLFDLKFLIGICQL
jgi:hypothetical protein